MVTSPQNKQSKRVEIDEICKDLGIGRSFAYAEIKAGRIPSITLGARRRIVLRPAYERWLASSGGQVDAAKDND